MLTFVSINTGYGGAEKLFDKLYYDFCSNQTLRSDLRYVRQDVSKILSINAFKALFSIRKNTVVLNMSVLGIGFSYLFILKILGNKIILFPHVVISAKVSRPKLWMVRFLLQRLSVKLANYIIAISDGNYSEMAHFIPKDKLHVVYNYVECENDKPISLRQLNKEIAIIGRLQNSHKQQLTFIKNQKNLILEHGLIIRLFGSGPDEQSIREEVELNGLQNNVFFHGWLTEREIYSFDFSFVLNISRWEGLPLSVMEAIYHDRIVIGSDISGNRELIDQDYLFNDHVELGRVLISVVVNGEIDLDTLANQKHQLYARYNKKKSLNSFSALVRRV